MKTMTKVHKDNDRLLSGAERGIMRQLRRLKKASVTLKRKQDRATKQLEREAYDWASLGQ